MRGIFGGMFDFNHDGKMSALESAVEFMYLDDLIAGDEAKTELELSVLDPEALEFMDAEERRETLRNAGLDPDEYDF